MELTKAKLCFLAAALAANLLLAGGPGAGEAHACSCAVMPEVDQELRASDAVFVGELERRGVRDPDPHDDVPLTGVEFSVKEYWKGAPGGSVVVYGQGEGYGTSYEEDGKTLVVENSCDFQFSRDGDYLVYATRSDGLLEASTCGRTASLGNAGKDLRVLGPPEGSLPDTGGYGVSAFEGAMISATVLALAGALALQRIIRRES